MMPEASLNVFTVDTIRPFFFLHHWLEKVYRSGLDKLTQGQMVQLWAHAESFHASSQALIRFPSYSTQSSSRVWIVLKALITSSSHTVTQVSKLGQSRQVKGGKLAIINVCQPQLGCHLALTHISESSQEPAAVRKVCKV